MKSGRFFRVIRTIILVLAAAVLLPAAISAGELQTEPLTVKVFRADPGSQPAENNRIYQMIEQQLGIRFEFEFLEGNLDETVGLLVENPYPDLIDGSNSANALEQAGVLVDMLPYITEEGTPNLYRHIYTDDRVSKMTCDGALYIIPNYGIIDNEPIVNENNGSSFLIQKQVIAWNNYEVPTTLNEYFDLIERFVAAHPDDGYTGFEMLCDDWRNYALLNPVQHLMGRPNDGVVLVDVSTPEYTTETFINQDYAKAYYAKLNEEYNKGIVGADTFNLDYDTYLDSIAGGKVLGMFDQKWNLNPVAGALAEGESYLAIPLVYDPEYVNGQEIEEHYMNGSTMNTDRGFGISVSCEDPERMVQLFDTLLSDEWQTILQWGILGEDYTVDENGRMIMTAEQYSRIMDDDWRLANMADALFQSSPKKQGTMDDGNSWSPGTQPEIYFETMSDYDREFLAACGKQTPGEFFNPPIELAPYGEAWQLDTSPIGEDYYEFLGIQEERLPEIITCNPDELDGKWSAFIEEITPSATVVTNYMQEAVLTAVNGGGGENENRCGEALTWTYDEYGTVTISGTGDMYDYEDAADVPWAEYAYDIGTVIIENGVTSIGNNAFNGCVCLEGISIANGVTSIGDLALNGCGNLGEISLPVTVTEIGNGAFQDCRSLRIMVVPKNVSRLKASVFQNCTGLAAVYIPAGMEEIDAYAFHNCQNLYDVYYAGTEEEWEAMEIGTEGNEYLLGAARHFSAQPVVDSGNCGAEGDNVKWALDFYGTLTISGTGAMADYGMGNQTPWRWTAANATGIQIADGITRIGNWAFRYMTRMTEIEIPASVESIGEQAFEGWTSLQTVYYDGTRDEWAEVAISEKGNEYLLAATVWCLGPHEHEIVIDPAVARADGKPGLTEGSHCAVCGQVFTCQELIGADMGGECGRGLFWGMNGTGTLYILGNGEMYNFSQESPSGWSQFASDIRKVEVIGEGVRSIGAYAFESCVNLSEVSLNEGLTGIGRYAFGNTNLATVTIPATVKTLEQGAFNDCFSLASISVEPESLYFASSQGVLFDREMRSLIRYPVCKSGTAYSVPQGVTEIASAAFMNAGMLTSVELPDSLQTVAGSAFVDADSLEKVIFPAGAVWLRPGAFEYCSALRTVVFPGREVTVSEYAFTGCSSLNRVYYGGTQAESRDCLSAASEGNDPLLQQAVWYYGMTRLPDDLKGIEDEAFRNSGLSMVIIPEGCGEIGEYAFAGCTDLVYVRLPSTITGYPDTAFNGCHPDLVIVRAR